LKERYSPCLKNKKRAPRMNIRRTGKTTPPVE
jgi:hypothetical protein